MRRIYRLLQGGIMLRAGAGAILFAAILAPAPGRPPVSAAQTQSAKFAIASQAFREGATIPRNFTCDGEDISPRLSWTEPPAGTRSVVLIANDPDAPAGTWAHWVVYNLPASARQLPQATPKSPELQGGARQGVNDFGKTGYIGPCPPPGKPHRYYFNLYALDSKVGLSPGATKTALETAMKGHILAEARMMARYGR